MALKPTGGRNRKGCDETWTQSAARCLPRDTRIVDSLVPTPGERSLERELGLDFRVHYLCAIAMWCHPCLVSLDVIGPWRLDEGG